MKILQVNKFLYPKGGAEIVCLGLADALREAGHEVLLFGMDDPRNAPNPDADCFPRGVDYHAPRGLGRKTGEALRTIYGRQARAGMARLLDRRRPDLIHCHNIYHQLTPAILAPARSRGIPVLLTLHDYKPLCPVYTFLSRGEICERCLGRTPWPLLVRRCKDDSVAASAVLFAEAALHRTLGSYRRGVSLYSSPSRFLRDKMIAAGTTPERIVHLPNGLPFPDAVLDAPWQAPPNSDRPQLIWVGRMSHEKGLATLLEAVARCERPLELLLVGDGPEEPALRRLAAELGLGSQVRWLGRRTRAEVAKLIGAAEGAVLPSEWYENAPLALLEAMALGRPVIASDLGGVPEMFTSGASGWLFPAGDSEALAATLADWGASRGRRQERGQAAHAEARRRFHPHRILEDTLSLYQRLIA